VNRTVRYLAWFAAIIVVGAFALGGSLALAVPAAREVVFGTTAYGSVLPKVTRQAQRSVVFDKYGNQIQVYFSEDRSPVELKDVPKTLIDAVLSIEDRNFYEHNGVDVKALGRAFVDNLGAGSVQQGGSTITQQLVKQTLIKDPKRELRRKIQEAFLATRLEKELTKNQILRQYLNVIYLGNGAYGVRSASERYFGKEPKALTLAESALIAGLIQSPERLNPITHPALARRRRAQVLDAMATLHRISPGAAKYAKRAPLPTQAHSPLARGNDANSYFLEEVKKRLLHDDPNVEGDVGEVLGADDQARYQAVFKGGLKIYTTFDPFMQNSAQAAVNDVLPASQFTAALVAMDNSNGAVVAMVGGPNFQSSKFNLATQGVRQTGSTFKGVTLATALEAGYSPNDSVNGSHLSFPLPGDDWELDQDCGGGVHSLSDAIAESDNCAFARTLISLGPGKFGSDGANRVIDMAGRLGIDREKLSAVPSLTLGTSQTSVLEMTGAYSVFANNGIRKPPMFVKKVTTSDDRVLFEDPGTGTPVLNPQIAQTETAMLRGVIQHGTGTGANIGRPAAGKTGTTTAHADAWFVGYTPQYTAGVWMGDPLCECSMSPILGDVFGGKYPAQMWAEFMKAATAKLPPLDFIPPNQSLWPSPQYIDETGRKVRVFVPPPTAPPVTVAPTPATNAAKPPKTTPPKTKPPKPAPKPPNSQP
jgi:membrane peptidoglycan carboxypeptidase